MGTVGGHSSRQRHSNHPVPAGSPPSEIPTSLLFGAPLVLAFSQTGSGLVLILRTPYLFLYTPSCMS